VAPPRSAVPRSELPHLAVSHLFPPRSGPLPLSWPWSALSGRLEDSFRTGVRARVPAEVVWKFVQALDEVQVRVATPHTVLQQRTPCCSSAHRVATAHTVLQQRTPCCVASHRRQRVGQAPAAYFATCCAALPPPRRVVVRCNIAAEAASGLQPPPRHIRADPCSCLHERRAVAVSGRQQRRSSCLYRVRTRRFRTRTGPTPATSALGLGSPPLHLRQDWARPCHICARTGPAPATSAVACHTHIHACARTLTQSVAIAQADGARQ